MCEFIRKIKSDFSKVQANRQESDVNSDVLIGVFCPQNKMGSTHLASHAMIKPAWSPKILIFLSKVAQPEQSQRGSVLALPCSRSLCHPIALSAWLCLPSGGGFLGAAFEPGSGLQKDGCLADPGHISLPAWLFLKPPGRAGFSQCFRSIPVAAGEISISRTGVIP